MFKQCVISVCVVAASGLAGAANAADKAKQGDSFFKPYIGADYQYSKSGDEDFGSGVKTNDLIDTGLHGGNIHIGTKVHPNLGFELGYFRTEDGDKNIGGGVTTKVRVQGGTLDAMGYYPVAKQLELIGTIGVSYSKADLSIPSLGLSGDSTEWKPRAGAGAQYWISDNLNARGLVRYQGADFDGIVNNAVVATAGINYQF